MFCRALKALQYHSSAIPIAPDVLLLCIYTDTDGLRETIDSTCKGHGKELAEEVGMVVHTADWTVLCEWLDGFGELAHAADQITERATA